MSDQNALVLRLPNDRLLTRDEFNALADVPPEVEWFANLENPNTRRAYRNDLNQFVRFTCLPFSIPDSPRRNVRKRNA